MHHKSTLLGLMALVLFAPRIASAQSPSPGEAVYQSHCAACHEHSDVTRAPSRDNLGQMEPSAIDYALTQGKMQAQGQGLSGAERRQLIDYLTGNTQAQPASAFNWAASMMCPADRRTV